MSEASARQGTTTEGHGFGTAPVFLASVSTILGAIMFLRFGYAVGHVGLQGALLIILLGHLVTIPTALDGIILLLLWVGFLAWRLGFFG
jgi:hypothetical protein